jgi:hypothetical protein
MPRVSAIRAPRAEAGFVLGAYVVPLHRHWVDLQEDFGQIRVQCCSPFDPAIFADEDHQSVLRGYIQLLA